VAVLLEAVEGRAALSECASRHGRRGRAKRERAGGRLDRPRSTTSSAGLHGAEVLELDDRSVVVFSETSRLFLHSFDSVATIRRLVAFDVHEHNHVLPHSAFRGQTPDEMYVGNGEAVATDLTARALAARRARVATNRSASCTVCSSLDAVA
jgi:hypothetical protein